MDHSFNPKEKEKKKHGIYPWHKDDQNNKTEEVKVLGTFLAHTTHKRQMRRVHQMTWRAIFAFETSYACYIESNFKNGHFYIK